jgi:hypothetical protein
MFEPTELLADQLAMSIDRWRKFARPGIRAFERLHTVCSMLAEGVRHA